MGIQVADQQVASEMIRALINEGYLAVYAMEHEVTGQAYFLTPGNEDKIDWPLWKELEPRAVKVTDQKIIATGALKDRINGIDATIRVLELAREILPPTEYRQFLIEARDELEKRGARG